MGVEVGQWRDSELGQVGQEEEIFILLENKGCRWGYEGSGAWCL